MDPASQMAHHTLAVVYFYRHELDAFHAEAERAIALNPSNAFTLAAMGQHLQFSGDEKGVALVRKATKLDPFHPTWYYFAIAHYDFDRGEYEEALAAARKINIPGLFWPQIYLAAMHAELGRQSEAQFSVEELVRLYPGFNVERFIDEARKWKYRDESIRHFVAALRKAGLPE